MKGLLVFCCCIIVGHVIIANAVNIPCSRWIYNEDVCVCNDTYCDKLEIPEIPCGKFYHLVSDKDGKRFEGTFHPIKNESEGSSQNHYDHIIDTDVAIKIDRHKTYQKIFGFGGAMSDAASQIIMGLSEELRKFLIESYFATDGLCYNIARVNIGGCDFSTRPYALDDVVGDGNLTHFALAKEDLDNKIPCLKLALRLNKKIKIFGSPWSAPTWMKSNDAYNGLGVLSKKYYKTWANYLVKFLEAYKKRGINFWAITTQNEPIMGILIPLKWNCMGWSPEDHVEFLKILGPALKYSECPDTEIIIYDDSRHFLLPWCKAVLQDPEVANWVSGIAVHWYFDPYSPIEDLIEIHNLFPNQFLLPSEACTGSITPPRVLLGSWERGEDYASSIIGYINHWAVGWVDWNLVLNTEGGPNWAGNFVDSPIIVNETSSEFYKQPMFYALGHFSKFIDKGSVRIHVYTEDAKGLEILAVRTYKNSVVVAILNKLEESQVVEIQDGEKIIKFTAGRRSFNTITYRID